MQPLTTLRYWAGLKDAAGTAEEQVRAATLADALAEVRARHDARFGQVLDRCSLLLDGQRVSGEAVLHEGAEVDCLPPFAGG